MVERGPHTMVDAPGVVNLHIAAQKLLHACRKVRVPGGAILDRVELRRKAVHVVHLARRGVALHQRAAREPVRRDGENRARRVCQELLAHRSKAVRHIVIPERHHGVAVTHEHRYLPLVCHFVLHRY